MFRKWYMVCGQLTLLSVTALSVLSNSSATNAARLPPALETKSDRSVTSINSVAHLTLPTQLDNAQALAKGILKEAYKNTFNIAPEANTFDDTALNRARPLALPNTVLSLELEKLLTAIKRYKNLLGPSGSVSASDTGLQRDTASLENLVAKLHPSPAAERSAKVSPEQTNKFPWPISGDIFSTPGSAFREGGAKWPGILIKANAGTNVQSIAAGKVVYAGEIKNLGLLVIIDHEDGHLSLYGRNSKIFVSQDQRVKKHQTISAVEALANDDQVGLYFEIRRDGKPMDPRLLCYSAPMTNLAPR